MKRRLITIILATIMILSSIVILVPPVASDGGGGSTRGVSKVLMWVDLPSSTTGWLDYMVAVQAYGASFTRTTSVPSLAYMQQFDVVIYSTGGYLGNGWPSSSDRVRMQSYLDSGGKMVWTGNFPAWCASMSSSTPFINTYFGAQQNPGMYHYFNGYNHNMVGANGNLEITGNWMVYYAHPEIYANYYFHEYLNVVGNGVREMYCQNYPSQATMISVDHPTYQTVLWSWDLNHINSPSIQLALITKVLDFFSSGIVATVDVHPETLNLDSNGNWVSVEVTGFPEDPTYDPSQVIEGTVTLENIGSDPNGPSGYKDGAYKCKVDRLLLEDAIGMPGDSVELAIAGDVFDTSFAGTTTIRAIHGI